MDRQTDGQLSHRYTAAGMVKIQAVCPNFEKRTPRMSKYAYCFLLGCYNVNWCRSESNWNLTQKLLLSYYREPGFPSATCLLSTKIKPHAVLKWCMYQVGLFIMSTVMWFVFLQSDNFLH